MTVYELCIDLGSNNTTIYKKNTGVVLREPTLALIQTSSKINKVLKIGQDADKMMGKVAENEVFVRPIVEGVIKNMEITQKILTYFLNKVVNYKLIKPVIKVLVCLPVGLNESEYEDYKKLFYSIGFAKIDFIYNVVSCSLAESVYLGQGKTTMLVNIGAGKTEIATLTGGKIIKACSLNVGGNNIDADIVDYLQATKGYLISQAVAKKIKNEIGSLYETDKSSMEVVVLDTANNTQISTIITAKDIMKPIYENYFKILQIVLAFYNECSSECAQDIRNEGIFFYGGGALITGLEKFFKKILNLSVFVLDNPEYNAVIGSEKLFGNYNLLQKVIEEN